MNPTMADEEQAYNAGLMEGIRLIGEVVERQPEAEALIHYTFEARKQANAPVADIPQNQRVRVYMANPDLNTYGAGKYTGLMMAHAGALNVAAASVKGARQVSLEQVLEWNPQVIFVQDRYPQVVKQLPNIVFWLLGSFATASWHKVLLMSLPMALAAGVLWKLRWRINLLALEERDARSLGVPVAALRRGVLVCCAVLVAAQVAVSGSIAWMGLVVPHLARLLVGADHRRLLPTAFWLGAALMLVVDDLARTLTQAEIPIGIITALLGAPLFTVLLVQSRRRSTTR